MSLDSVKSQESVLDNNRDRILNVVRGVGEAANNHDTKAMESLLHDQFVYTDENGIRVTKSDVLARLPHIPQQVHSELEPPYIDVHGNMAVARYAMLGYMTVNNTRAKAIYRVTHTLILVDGDWKLLVSEAYQPSQMSARNSEL